MFTASSLSRDPHPVVGTLKVIGRSKDNEERLEEATKQGEVKQLLRKANLNPSYLDANALRSLDSSIKRNTAVMKKLKQITEESKESLLKDLTELNLSKYTSEAVSGICDAKLKPADIGAAVQVCSLLHQRYKDFRPALSANLAKSLVVGKGSAAAADESADGGGGGSLASKATKKRNLLRLLCELYLSGVLDDVQIIVSVIKDVASVEPLIGRDKDRDVALSNMTLVLTFLRHGRPLVGLPLPSVEEEIYADLNVTVEQKKHLLKLVTTFFDSAVSLLKSEHAILNEMEGENTRLLASKGEIPEDSSVSYDRQRKVVDQLLRSVTSLAEAMDKSPPELPQNENLTRVTAGEQGVQVSKEGTDPEPIWDDEDTKAFYESLPDLRALLPAVLLGEGDQGKGGDQSKEGDEASQDEKSDEVAKAVDDDTAKEEGMAAKGLDGASFESLLHRLPLCISRDLADQLSVDFCYLNSKGNRRKLVKVLFAAPRSKLELLPYYSRIAATLSTCMRDVGASLVQMLEDEFLSLMARKEQMNLESKLRNIRFLGELAKFRVAPSSLIFSTLKACLDDFSHHSIDVACGLLETCGRFLMRSPETSLRMGNLLDTLMRLKNAKNLDNRQATIVDNAYYQCRPPERSSKVAKARPPIHMYIRKLLFLDLDRTSIERVLRQLRRMPWDSCQPYIAKCFIKVHRMKYSQLNLFASLAAGLGKYHDDLTVAVVDQVLEEVRVGLEENVYGMEQRRVTTVRLLGELYNYRLIDSPIIFDTLYLILFFGYGSSEQSRLDPADDYFRIRLVITLLDTCGQYFDRGAAKRRFDRFLLYFQRYILSKAAMPLDVEFDLQDLFASLRPKLLRYASLEEAHAAVMKMEEEERVAAAAAAVQAQLKRADRGPGHVGPVPGQEPDGDGVDEGSDSDGDSGGSQGDGAEFDDDGEEYENEKDGGSDGEDGGQFVGESEEEPELRLNERFIGQVDPEEEAQFEKELRAVMQESIDKGKLEKRSGANLHIAIPMMSGEPMDAGSGSGGREGPQPGFKDRVAMRVLVKKGNKQQSRQLLVPADSGLVQAAKQKEAMEAKEKEDIKRRVLAFNDREEDDTAAMPLPHMQPSQATPVNRSLSLEDIPSLGPLKPSTARSWGASSRQAFARRGRPVAAGGHGRRR